MQPLSRSPNARFLALFLCIAPACGVSEDLEGPEDDAVPVQAQAEPSGYYDSARGKTGAALLQALRTRIGGHKALSYSAARNTLFATLADGDNDDVVACVYTGRRANAINSSSTAGQANLNTEHTWPQSLGAKGDAQSDLHHLFPTDSTANSRRGNYPFGVVTTVTWAAPNLDGADGSRLGRDASGRTVFEPQNSIKGDIARALLYFFTRYDGARPSGYTTSNFNAEQTLLIRWHQQDPPDAAERQRNDGVYGVQGNRNPYIDHPEYVAAIGTFR